MFQHSIRRILFLALIIAFLHAVSAGRICIAQTDEVDWKTDIQFLKRELPKKHVNFFSQLKKEEYERACDELSARCNELTAGQLQLEMLRLIGLAKDGHSGLVLDHSKLHYLPINARYFDDGITIVAADKKRENLVGGKITAVNGIQVEKLLAQLRPYVPHDNLQGLKSRIDRQFNLVEWLQAATGSTTLEHVELTIEKGGKSFEQRLPAIPHQQVSKIQWSTPASKLPLYMKKSHLNFWNDWIADHKMVYFKYNRCTDAKGFTRLVNGTRGFIKQNGDVQKLVIDLRNNGGGNSAIFAPLLRTIQNDKTLNQKGRLFVIIGRQTYSSAMWNTLDMRNQTHAILVGESIGGKPNHFGELKTFKLPSSGLTVYYSTRKWVLDKTADPETVEPDLPVKFRAKDYFEGRDPYLEAIINYDKK